MVNVLNCINPFAGVGINAIRCVDFRDRHLLEEPLEFIFAMSGLGIAWASFAHGQLSLRSDVGFSKIAASLTKSSQLIRAHFRERY
jgi:hypothetical protein